ncbi:hypothetical protein AHAS_Ahas02G0079100 [Arachis hypogaea]
MSTFRQVPDSNTTAPISANTISTRPTVIVRSSRIDLGQKYISTVEEENINDIYYNNKKKNRGRQSTILTSTKQHSVNTRKLDLKCLGYGLLEIDDQGIDEIHYPNPIPMTVARGGASSMRDPMNLFVKRSETVIARNKREKLRQHNIKEACNKKAIRRVHRYITQ